MTTPPADPKTTPPAGDGEADRIATIDQKIAAVKDEILAEVRKIVGGAREREQGHLTDPDQSKTARAAQAGKSLDDMIADAIKVNDDARAKEAADKTREERLGKLEQAAAEKPPVERKRAHRFMGWGEPPQ
ncbi:MAG TPA: hypothetical protein VGR98_21080 [Streptosporangiaceae bacterium]|nr:hypothetical protein [Streptosporangiaceae bacterium]